MTRWRFQLSHWYVENTRHVSVDVGSWLQWLTSRRWRRSFRSWTRPTTASLSTWRTMPALPSPHRYDITCQITGMTYLVTGVTLSSHHRWHTSSQVWHCCHFTGVTLSSPHRYDISRHRYDITCHITGDIPRHRCDIVVTWQVWHCCWQLWYCCHLT